MYVCMWTYISYLYPSIDAIIQIRIILKDNIAYILILTKEKIVDGPLYTCEA